MNILLINANFYTDISEMMIEGAVSRLNTHGAEYELVTVPGALEIPPTIAMASESQSFDGYVALGCVIRGETSHYDTVCNESSRGIMELGITRHLAIGNGILTVENREQAIIRADKSQKNKGGGAVDACLALIALRHKFMPQS